MSKQGQQAAADSPAREAILNAAPDEGNNARGRRLTQLDHLGVTELSGIGPARARGLEAMGITNVLDLLLHYPRRYADRSHPTAIADLVEGVEAMVVARVHSLVARAARGRRSVVELIAIDATGRLVIVFFNQPYRRDQLHEGDEVTVFGRVERYRGRVQMTNPIVDLVGDQTGAIIPIYPQSQKAGVTSRELHRYLTEALRRAGHFADPLSTALRAELGLVDRTTAMNAIHLPDEMDAVARARRRLAFEELLRLQIVLVARKRARALAARGIAHRIVSALGEMDLVEAFLTRLPFPITGAQQRAIAAIAADLASAQPMHRLLQGDVGSGKTVVALATLLYGIQGGHQGALMVPTEVLAEQHVAAIRALLSGLHVGDPGRLTQRRELVVALLTSEITGSERDRVYEGLREGTIDLVVGTHALLSAEVRFSSLGVVVIDEQHRFGVDQRALLRERASLQGGHDPDLLVMTATPIPRTAAMTVYGDLDYSELDEMPPGRTPIRTRWVSEESDEPRVWSRVRAEVARGAQAFVVCARVHPDESEGESGVADPEGPDLEGLVYLHEEGEAEPRLFGTSESATPKRRARSAIEEFDRLRDGELAGLRVGLLHGQMRADDKERVMTDLREGFLDVLVATTVIEVGVDIPRATVMVIADADRFGIAQLHQLRGRVGRGGGEAFCYLLGYEVGEQARARLSAMVATTDGFALAEVDLELRGEGTLLANRQRGRNDLRLASLRRDRELVALARRVAIEMIEDDPTLSQHELLAEELSLFVDEEGAQYLARS